MKLLLLFIACTTLIVSCAGTSSSGELISSCSEITCSGHGKCVSNDGIPECKCDNGYIDMGSECVLDCSGIANSKVNVYNNACECQVGFEAVKGEDGNLLVSCGCEDGKVLKAGICVTECSDPHATTTGFGESCICDAGYINIGSVCTFDCRNIANAYPNNTNDGCECESDFEKVGDECIYSCNKAGNMKANAFNSGCECEEGFYATNEIDVCASSCEGVSCEDNARCLSSNEESFVCECNPERSLKLNYLDTLVYDIESTSDMRIATNNGESYGIVWQGISEDGFYNISMLIVDTNGEPIKDDAGNPKGPFVVNGIYADQKIDPKVIWNGEKYAVVWEDRRFTVPGKVTRDIYMRLISETGEMESEKHITFTTNQDSYAYSPKIVWNASKSNFAIFWKESKRDGDSLGNPGIYYIIISASGNDYLTNTKLITAVDQVNHDYDVIVNGEGDYSMVWTRESNYRLMYQVLNSDVALIDSDGPIKKSPVYLTYNPSIRSSNPRLFLTGNDYTVIYSNASNLNYVYMTHLNAQHQKIGSEINTNIRETLRDVVWTGDEFLLSWTTGQLYTIKLSWDGLLNKRYTSGDGLSTIINSRLLPIDKNNKSVFWMDNRNNKFEIYFSKLGCF